MSLQRDLEGACATVKTGETALESVSTDESSSGPREVPAAYVLPESPAEIAAVLEVARAHGVSVTPRGAGTGKAGACVCAPGGVVLGTERMTAVLDVDVESTLVRVSPGVILSDLKAAVTQAGLRYPPDPASQSMCTVGGTAATNAGGPCALRYGVTGDYVLGLECVLPSGETPFVGRRSPKGVAGYDLASLLVGSEGTLAVFTELVLRLVPQAAGVATAIFAFDDAASAARAVTSALTSQVWPSALEYVDGASIAASRAAGSTAFPAAAGAAIIIETESDDDDAALAAIVRASEAMKPRDVHVAKHAADRRAIWDARRALSIAVRDLSARKVSEDVAVPRREVPALLADLDALGTEHGLMTCAYGHAGDGNIHAQILYDDDSDLPRVDALLDKLFRATIARGGTITGEHGVGTMKRRWLALEHPPAVLALERAVKAAFDPEGILNPGKVL